MRHRFTLLAIAVLALPRGAAGQAPPPLDKAELVRLLTNPLFAQAEVADVVRRSCLTFRPTDRDWADLRSAGAGGEVIASAAACDGRRMASAPSTAPADEPVQPMTAVALPADIITTAGTASSVRVRLSRGRTPIKRVTLALKGTTTLGLSRDAAAVTDDSGIAVFRLPAVARVGTHQFEIRTSSGNGFPGQPGVTLSVRAARPSRLRVTPDIIDFARTADSAATVFATVTDSLGNAIVGEPVEWNGGSGTPVSAVTDSAGRVSFVVAANSVNRGTIAQVRVRGLAPAELEIAAPAGLSGVNTGFVPLATNRGAVGTSLTEPLVFKARTVQGSAPSGRTVRFRALNARVTPESAVLDSTGRVAVDVVLGIRTGEAAVFATIDSVERIMTLRADPGPIDSLILERNGASVNGRSIVVAVGAPFALRLRAHDLYGNETSMDALGAALRASQQRLSGKDQNLQLVSLESADSAVVFTLRARQPGTYNFVIGSGIRAAVRVDAIP
jgi:hypothetical protein